MTTFSFEPRQWDTFNPEADFRHKREFIFGGIAGNSTFVLENLISNPDFPGAVNVNGFQEGEVWEVRAECSVEGDDFTPFAIHIEEVTNNANNELYTRTFDDGNKLTGSISAIVPYDLVEQADDIAIGFENLSGNDTTNKAIISAQAIRLKSSSDDTSRTSTIGGNTDTFTQA